jgi:myo-inositol-1-phosphate synthase
VNRPNRIRPTEGRLAVLLPGMGAVATTTIAGVLLARHGLAEPIGSLTQMSTIRLGRRTSGRTPKIADFVSLAKLDDLVFGGWDVFPGDAYARAVEADVLRREHLDRVRDELERIRPMPAAFYPEYVRRLVGQHVKKGRSKADMVEQLRDDMRRFVRERECARAVCIWCGSTETFTSTAPVHESVAAFERGLLESDPAVTSSQLYAWACL